MADILTDRNSDYDGSPDGEDDVQTAAGNIIVTLSGTLGAAGRVPTMTMYSRSDNADFVGIHHMNKLGRFRANLADGDEYYFSVTGIADGASIDLAVADA